MDILLRSSLRPEQMQNYHMQACSRLVENALHWKDAKVAKNYLSEEELDTLNRIVSMYLDFAEL